MRVEEIRKQSIAELNNKVFELKKRTIRIKIPTSYRRLEKPKELNEIKKTIARIKTVITEKEMQE